MFDGVDDADAARAGVLLASNFQRFPRIVERFFEQHSSPLLNAAGYFVYIRRVPVILERITLSHTGHQVSSCLLVAKQAHHIQMCISQNLQRRRSSDSDQRAQG